MFSLTLILPLLVCASAVAASPAAKPADGLAARVPFPIPRLAHANLSDPLIKRGDSTLFGGYFTTKEKKAIRMEAPLNTTTGQTWCNELKSGTKDKNKITKAHVDSNKFATINPKDLPPQYVCFFYESKDNCDPDDGHAEYVVGEYHSGKDNDQPKDTEFGSNWNYIHWGCAWHPENPKYKKIHGGGGGD